MYRTESSPSPSFSAAALVAAFERRHPLPRSTARQARYPSRDVGTGYGRSSGYAAPRSYIPGSQPPSRFRVV